MTTTPEPAVSPAPDTDALRAYLRRTIGGDFERRLIAADLLDDDDALSVLRVFEDVVPAIEREITSRHEAFVLMLADAKAERDERIAGLRADLAEALAEVRRLADERYRLRQEARSAGARTIPDDAAERLTYALFRMSPGLFCDAPVAPINALTAALWKHVWRDLADHERAEWQAYGRTVLAQVLEATPTTGPDDVSLAQYHLSTRLQGVLEEWGIGNGCDRLRLDDIETARLLRQLVAAIPPTTGPAPAAAFREMASAYSIENLPDNFDAAYRLDPQTLRACAEMLTTGTLVWPSDRLLTDRPAAPQAPAQPTARVWRFGDAQPAGVKGVTDREGRLWWFGGDFWRCVNDRAITPGNWGEILPIVGPLTESFVTQDEMVALLNAPAAREDTAPPAWTEHDIDVTHQDDGWATAECRTCGASIGESTEDTVEDWADAHRADNLIPPRSSAPAVDGDTDA